MSTAYERCRLENDSASFVRKGRLRSSLLGACVCGGRAGITMHATDHSHLHPFRGGIESVIVHLVFSYTLAWNSCYIVGPHRYRYRTYQPLDKGNPLFWAFGPTTHPAAHTYAHTYTSKQQPTSSALYWHPPQSWRHHHHLGNTCMTLHGVRQPRCNL